MRGTGEGVWEGEDAWPAPVIHCFYRTTTELRVSSSVWRLNAAFESWKLQRHFKAVINLPHDVRGKKPNCPGNEFLINRHEEIARRDRDESKFGICFHCWVDQHLCYTNLACSLRDGHEDDIIHRVVEEIRLYNDCRSQLATSTVAVKPIDHNDITPIHRISAEEDSSYTSNAGSFQPARSPAILEMARLSAGVRGSSSKNALKRSYRWHGTRAYAS